jgi:hypothetical protein
MEGGVRTGALQASSTLRGNRPAGLSVPAVAGSNPVAHPPKRLPAKERSHIGFEVGDRDDLVRERADPHDVFHASPTPRLVAPDREGSMSRASCVSRRRFR